MSGQRPTLLSSTHVLLARYDAFILDLWGCTHDGISLYPGARAFLEAAQAARRPVCFLSNSPRLPELVVQSLLDKGLPRDAFVDVVTSGGEAFSACLDPPPESFHSRLGRRMHYAGPEDASSVADALIKTGRFESTESVHSADWVLLTDLKDEEDITSCEPLLVAAKARALPIVCANADNRCMLQDRELVCSGAVARAYAAAGGDAFLHGKPSPSVFQLAFDRLQAASPLPLQRSRLCMVGDALETDVAGASAFGCDSLLVLTGIHAQATGTSTLGDADVMAKLSELCLSHSTWPTHVARAL